MITNEAIKQMITGIKENGVRAMMVDCDWLIKVLTELLEKRQENKRLEDEITSIYEEQAGASI